MKASELRIGNYILDDNGRLDSVWSLEHNVEYMLNERFGESEAQPIPITDAVLEAINGELKELIASECELGVSAVHIHMTTDGFSIAKYGDIYAIKRPLRCTPQATFSSLQVEHLHQLQNLYHALTGNELEIDETKLKQAIANEDK